MPNLQKGIKVCAKPIIIAYTKLTNIFDLENYQRGLTIRLPDKLSDAKRPSSHLWKDNYIKKSDGQKLRIHERFRVLKEVHEGWAHYPKDQKKFRAKISERFFFPQISEVTKEFISTCEGCQLKKAGVASRTDRDLHHTPPTRPYF
jgi:hypothetical protein